VLYSAARLSVHSPLPWPEHAHPHSSQCNACSREVTCIRFCSIQCPAPSVAVKYKEAAIAGKYAPKITRGLKGRDEAIHYQYNRSEQSPPPGPVFSDCLPNQPATSYFSSCCKDIECRRLNDPPERPLEMVRGITFAYVDFQHGFGNTRREGESRNN